MKSHLLKGILLRSHASGYTLTMRTLYHEHPDYLIRRGCKSGYHGMGDAGPLV